MKRIAEYDYSLGFSLLSDCRYGGYGLDGAMKVFGDELYFISCHEKSSLLKKISLDGNIEIISDDIGSVDGFDICEDEILFYGLRGMRLQEIYSLKDGKETQLTGFNEDVYLDRKISFPERLVFENECVRIDGYVLKPVDYDENKTYPGILNIHGGPKNLYGEIFFHEMQVCASEGYFVFYCNPRGSDGRGDSFADISGKYGTIDYDDLMKFTDLVLEKYSQIDPNRIAVTGGSYGGFMTNWIIGHTDRFKCAVSLRSIANWISKFGTTDIGYFFVQSEQGANPWTNSDKLWFHSPMKYANKVKTPTLFIHAENDYRCWFVEGLQMFTSLKYFGVESRFCLFRDEHHDLSRTGKPTHRIRRMEEIMNWYEKYLK